MQCCPSSKTGGAALVSRLPGPRAARHAMSPLFYRHQTPDSTPPKSVRARIKLGFDEDEAKGLADAAEQGKTLLAALVSEDQADQAASIMDRFEAAQDEGQSTEQGSAASVPIVEEGLVVGKAKFATGGVRATSRVEDSQP